MCDIVCHHITYFPISSICCFLLIKMCSCYFISHNLKICSSHEDIALLQILKAVSQMFQCCHWLWRGLDYLIPSPPVTRCLYAHHWLPLCIINTISLTDTCLQDHLDGLVCICVLHLSKCNNLGSQRSVFLCTHSRRKPIILIRDAERTKQKTKKHT